jgi:hypothetical protein
MFRKRREGGIIKEVFNYLILAASLAVSNSISAPVSTDITFKGAHEMELAGTFEAPAGAGPFPAVVLLPGSGPSDRDGNSYLLQVKVDILKQIADRLATDGVASLRFDKRAIARYKDLWPKTIPEINTFFSWRNFVEDAEGALAALKARPEIDPARVGMLGHSEGALITLQIASELPQPPAAIVLVGSTGRKMGAVLHDQIARNLSKSPTLDPKPYLDYCDAACDALAAGNPLPPNPPKGLEGLFTNAYLDLMGNYCRIDPTDLARKYAGPVLVVNGQDDTQVLAEKDTPRLVEALKTRSSGDLKVDIVPKASHCLKSTASGEMDAFGGPVIPEALDTISSWLAAHLAKNGKS